MNATGLYSAAALLSLAASPHAQAQMILGPHPSASSPYLSFTDSPFNGVTFVYFHLEDWEDNVLNTPGASSSSSTLSSSFGTSLIDSVDADDGTIDGLGQGGNANWAGGTITYAFDAMVLGVLPTHAGLVWTDGVGTITFEAFDADGVSLGTATGNHADGNNFGGTAEDRFYGAINPGGISRITISNPGGIEADHLQYGAVMVPEPGTNVLLASGMIGMLFALHRRRKQLT